MLDRKPGRLSVLMLAVGALTLTACEPLDNFLESLGGVFGGDEEVADEPEETEPPAAAEDAAEEAPEPEEPDDGAPGEEPADEAAPEDGPDVDEVRTLLERGAVAAVRVVYDVDDGGAGDVDQLTVAFDGDGRRSTLIEGPAGNVQLISDPTEDTAVVCSDEQGQWLCIEAPEGQQDMFIPGTLGDELVEVDPELLDDAIDIWPDTILDRAAVCLSGIVPELEARDIDEPSIYCADRETGVMLLASGQDYDANDFVVEAVEVAEPTDDDFTPPVEPVSPQEMGG